MDHIRRQRYLFLILKNVSTLSQLEILEYAIEIKLWQNIESLENIHSACQLIGASDHGH